MTKDYLNTFDEKADGKEQVNAMPLKNIPWIDIYFVMSMDGVVAVDHMHDIRAFSSREDREFFLKSIRDYDGIIVSSRTYVKDASPGTRRVILTHSAPSEDGSGSSSGSGSKGGSKGSSGGGPKGGSEGGCKGSPKGGSEGGPKGGSEGGSEGGPDPLNIYMSGDERRICEKMWDLGFKKAALAAGPSTCLSFLRAGLVKDLYLSIEPVALGSGIRLFTDEKFVSRWTLIESRRLNEKGTMMMHYRNIDSASDH